MPIARKPGRTFEGRKGQALGRTGAGMNLVGDQIRMARLSRTPQWSQEDLSQAIATLGELELSAAVISRVERGERSVYDFELRALCRALQLDANALLKLEKETALEPEI